MADTDNFLVVEYKRFKDLEFDLLTQNEILKEKLSLLDVTNHSVDGGQLKTVWMMESWSTADSLRRMENRMRDDRDELVKLDKSIVILYIKIISFQCSKVTSMLKKLDHMIAKESNSSSTGRDVDCPVDYTVQSYQEWTRTNPKLHALQSQVLELLNKKIKYRSKFIAEEKEEKLRTFTLNDCPDGVSRLRSQTMFYLERDPLVDADFTLHVSKCVNVEANTFEAERMRDFIAYCWDNDDDEDLASMYQQFVCALVEHIMNKFGHMRRSGLSKSDLTKDQVFAVIESYLMPHIYDCISKDHPDDATLKTQYKALRNKTQQDLGVQANYIDPSLLPYNDAVQKLREISVVRLPTQKLRSVILASQSALKRMSELCTEEEVVPGADEFIDVWVYVTIQASVPDLCWDIQYLKDFSNSSYMLSETGYYLSSLEMSSEYIKRLDSDNLDIVEAPPKKRFLFLPDCRAVQILLCRSERDVCDYFERVDKKEHLLEGYLMVASLDMIRDTSRLLRVALKSSHNSSDVVRLQPIKLSDDCTEDVLSRYLRLNCFKDVALKKLDCGSYIPILSQSSPTAVSDLITFSDLNSNWPHLLNHSALKFLGGCFDDVKLENIHDLNDANRTVGSMVTNEFGFHMNDDDILLEDCLKNIIIEIQTRLRKLNLYSILLPMDGVCTKVLLASLQRFKEMNDNGNVNCNSTSSSPQQQMTTSALVCDYQTFCRMELLTESITPVK